MEKLALIILCILGAAALVVVAGLAFASWAIYQIDKEEQLFQDNARYILRDGVIVEEHDVSGLLEE